MTERFIHPVPEVAISVVIPVYNEEQNIKSLVQEIDGELDGYEYEVVWVEDSSTDGTVELVDNLASQKERHRAIHLSRQYGQSAALSAGFDAARNEIVVPMDGDGQNDPSDIPELVEWLLLGDWDCVSGRRADRQDPWHKTIPSAIQTRLAKLTGPDIHDFGCTLTAYRKEALDDIRVYGEGHRYIPAKLHDKGYSVTELEVNHRPREHGESRYGAGRLIRGFADLAFHWFWNGYSSRPFHLFGGAGFVIGFFGLVAGLWLTIAKYWLGQALGPNLPQLLLCVSMVLFGTLLVFFGVVLEYLGRIYYRDEREYRIDRVVE